MSDGSPALELIEGKEFTGVDVPLDGKAYIRCTFRSCRFVFRATGGFDLDNSHIGAECVFVFAGHALDTLNAMKAIYGMGPFGVATILNTFQAIAPDLKKLN